MMSLSLSQNTTNYDVDVLDLCAGCEYSSTDTVEYILLVTGSAVSLVSVVENTFLCYIFVSQPRFRSSHLFYMAFLAAVDVFVSINYLLLMSMPALFDFTHSLPMFHVWLAYVRPMLAFSHCALIASPYLIVAATTERYAKTLHTITVHYWMKTHRYTVLFGVFLLSFVLRVGYYFELEVRHCADCDGFAEYVVDGSDFFYEHELYATVLFYLRNIVCVFLPILLLVGMNLAILLDQSRHRRKLRSHEASRGVRQTTLMLFWVVTLYLLSQSLNVVVTAWEFIDRHHLAMTYPNFYKYSVDAVSLFTVIACALRLPVYCMCNTQINCTLRCCLSNIIPACSPHLSTLAEDSLAWSMQLMQVTSNLEIDDDQSIAATRRSTRSLNSPCIPIPSECQSKMEKDLKNGITFNHCLTTSID